MSGPISKADEARFDKYLGEPDTNGCRLWAGSAGNSGYGKFWLNGKHESAHRVAFAIAHGRWPVDVARHTCDTRLCCNSNHLIEGSYRDNTADCIARGGRATREAYTPRTIHRGASHYSRSHPEKVLRGERVGTSKLTAEQVADIRAARLQGVRLKVLAARYGVTESNISQIARGKGWRT